jgi:hypothetical protein
MEPSGRAFGAPKGKLREIRATELQLVITGLVPVIPLRLARCIPKRDGRVKPGHDSVELSRSRLRGWNLRDLFLERAPTGSANPALLWQSGWRSLVDVIDFDLGLRIFILEFQARFQSPHQGAVLRIEFAADFDDKALARESIA